MIAKSESGSAVFDIYTVIYDERIKCERGEQGSSEQSEMRALYTTDQPIAMQSRDQDTMI